MKKLSILFLLILSFQLTAQHKIGVRAGLNYSTIEGGELEMGEEIELSTGFHFGINYTYQVAPSFGVRAELLYVQRGYKYNFIDTIDGAYRHIRPLDQSKEPFVEIGSTELNMDYSNGYLSIPITAQLQLTPKWEIFGGASFDMLLNPTGRGALDFTSKDRPVDIFFLQSYDHHYRSDTIGEIKFLNTETTAIILDEERTEILKTESAYYHLTSEQKMGNKFKFVDMHLIFGFNYFINNGFYIGVRGQYGLFDLTNDDMDFSLRTLNPDNSYIKRNDRDKSRSLGVSIGFRF